MMNGSRKRGRPEKQVHVYSEQYEYLYSFANQAECIKYYGLTKGNLFGNNPYRLMPDGHYICRDRLGREGLRHAVRIKESKFCKKLSSDAPIEIFNKLGEKLGEFRSIREFSEITNQTYQSIHYAFRQDVLKDKEVNKSIDRELYFKLKPNDE